MLHFISFLKLNTKFYEAKITEAFKMSLFPQHCLNNLY